MISVCEVELSERTHGLDVGPEGEAAALGCLKGPLADTETRRDEELVSEAWSWRW